MQDSSKAVVVDFLRTNSFRMVLDAPCGEGWLARALGDRAIVDGLDLYTESAPGYRRFWKHDLDTGLPEGCEDYDWICCCEGLEHVGNPLLVLRAFHRGLQEGGRLIVTTPNVWYPQARLQYLFRGFFPSFPALADKVEPGTHLHITPWSFPQLSVYFRLAGFPSPQIIHEPMSKPKHVHERWLAWPARLYCAGKAKRAASREAMEFWRTAGSEASLLGRHLMVVATRTPAEPTPQKRHG